MTAPNTPNFSQPLVDGEITSAHGTTHGGADDILFKVRSSNQRGSADQLGQFRLLASRTATESGGNSQSIQNLWDSGYVGAPTTNALPVALRDAGIVQVATGPGQGQLGDAQGRVYLTGGSDATGVVHSEVWSAPYSGGSIGSWRQERSMTYYAQAGSTSANLSPRYAHGCCFACFGQAGGSGQAAYGRGGVPWLLCYGGFGDVSGTALQNLIGAVILPDGTLSPWVSLNIGGAPLAYCRLAALPNPYLASCLFLSGGIGTGSGTASGNHYVTAVRSAPVSAKTFSDWDTPGGWWQPISASGGPAGICGHNLAFDWANGKVFLIRGTDNTSVSQAGMYFMPFGLDINTWVFNNGNWTAMTAGTNASDAACLYFMAPNAGSAGNSPKGYLYILGGTTSNFVVDRSSGSTGIQIGTITFDASNNPSVTWGTSANALPTGTVAHGGVMGDHLAIGAGWPPWNDANFARISVLGGATPAAQAVNNVRSATLPATPSGASNSAWVSGVGAGLASGDMGTGGSVSADTAADAPAGGQVAAMTFGAITAVNGSLADGDQLLVTAWTTDRLGGDPSSPDYAALQIGQPPTISNVSPVNGATPSNGRPALSFSYNSGLGGAPEDHWQIQLQQASTVIYDTGLRYDQQNSVPAMTIAPLLAPSTAYTMIINVWSSGFDLSGAPVVSATSTTSFTTTAFAVPAVPTSFLASAGVAGINLSWTAVGGAAYYRVYHRRTGSPNWILLVDNLAAHNYVAMDHIAVGAAYDYTVSSVSATPAESAQATPFQTATIAAGQFTHYLHVAGNGTTYGVALQIQGSPAMALKQDAHSFLAFGQAAPVTRYGTADYHPVSFTGLLLDPTPATLKQLQAVMDQVQAGSICFYRDALGGMITCSFDADQSVSIRPPYYREVALKITEVADTVGPYLSSGSALGYPSFSAGRRLPLSTDERLL